MSSEEYLRAREKILDAVQVPKDAGLGYPITTVVGKQELCMENYRGILEYTRDLIRIQSKTGQIRIHGTGLQIAYYMNDEMKVTGTISSVEYL